MPVPEAMLRQVGDAEIEGSQVNGPTDANRRPKATTIYFVARFDQPIHGLDGWIGKRRLTGARGLRQELRCDRALCDRSWRRAADEGRPVVCQHRAGAAEPRRRAARTGISTACDASRAKSGTTGWARSKSREAAGAQQTKFYTDLWHALLGRRLTSDVDGKYCDMTGSAPRIRQIPLDAHGPSALSSTTILTPSG